MIDCRTRIGLSLQALLVFVQLAGIGLVVLGLVLDSSPSSALTISLILVGVFTAVSAGIGCCATHGNRCCFRTFLLLSTFTLLLQGTGLLALFIYPDDVIHHLTSSVKEQKKANDLLEQIRWIYLGVFIVECFALAIAIFLHCCCESALEFEPFEESWNDNKTDLSKLRTSIGKSSFEVESGISAKKLRQKMAKKYGHLSHTMDWGHNKKWWQFR